MIYKVKLSHHYDNMVFHFAEAADALYFMKTAAETFTPEEHKDNKFRAYLELAEEVNDGEEDI